MIVTLEETIMTLEDNLNDFKEATTLLSLSPVAMDFVTTLCGKKLGAGVYRSVYEYNLDSKFVIKVEPMNTNCNVTEFMMWQEIKNLVNELAWVKDWFAPVEWISPNGRLLLMRRTIIDEKRTKPTKVPKFLWDVKPDNFGWIGKNYVCHDYGQFYNFIQYGKGMRDVSKLW